MKVDALAWWGGMVGGGLDHQITSARFYTNNHNHHSQLLMPWMVLSSLVSWSPVVVALHHHPGRRHGHRVRRDELWPRAKPRRPLLAGGRGAGALDRDGVSSQKGRSDEYTEDDRPVYNGAPYRRLRPWHPVPIPLVLGSPKPRLGFLCSRVSSISTIGILMAGWSSANKYSLMGGLRAAGQLIAYELPLILAVVGVVIMAGTMSLTGIVEAQASWFSERGWSFGMPFILVQFVGFAVFMLPPRRAPRIPFDTPMLRENL